MHGNTAGLESADPSSPGDSGSVRSGAGDDPQQSIIDIEAAEALADQFEAVGEYKAAREVNDAVARYCSTLRQGQRSGEAAHGEASADERQVDLFRPPTY